MKTKTLAHIYANILRMICIIIGLVYLSKGELKGICYAIVVGLLSFIPYFLEKWFKIKISSLLFFIYINFLYVATFFGKATNLYRALFWWDNLVHFLSGILFFLIGLQLSRNLKITKKQRYIFILLLVCTKALFWELGEYISDSLFNTNWQEFKNINYEIFGPTIIERGHALVDSMTDIIWSLIGFTLSLGAHLIYAKDSD